MANSIVAGTVRVIPLGGVGQFGANATIIQTAHTSVLIDYGLMFPPDDRQPGVDFYINDPDLVLERFPDLAAIFITHGHEDHIGGLAFLLAKANLPIYTLPYTARLIAANNRQLPFRPDLHTVALGSQTEVGDISVEFIGVTHSIIQACALAVRTPTGTIIHSGDFKVDPLPGDGYPFQSERFRELGKAGVDLLLMDSTNATRPGFCPVDEEIETNWERLIQAARGRVFITTFSSHLPRIRRLAAIAARTGRKMVLLGKSMQRQVHLGLDLGYLSLNPGLLVDAAAAARLPGHEVLVVATGSQGEGQAALAKILGGRFNGVKFCQSDTVIFSSRAIPGNERKVALMVSELERMGIAVFTDKALPIHTSGHGYREDLAYLLALTKPAAVAPIHGEYHQLLSHHDWLKALLEERQNLLLLTNGAVIELTDNRARITHQEDVQLLPIDVNQTLPLPKAVMRERKDLMYSGLLVIACTFHEGMAHPHFDVSTCAMVEPSPGHWARTLLEALADLSLSVEHPIEVWSQALGALVKKTLRGCYRGKPVTKVIINGTIVK